ncbi:lantibiotic ABC superfamily ATP binding cassette transporter permease protein [Streptococcus sanguinis SK408]|uniref:Lantibiotic ABC superfamily ATP binding cassette transporter permease protein n=1 Tax=Streptococcus sanguinis SK408 TaxID=888818 RepID=F2CEC0_STRSA|nr:lantibiotic ABC superfamily ATP binding cassette transporter permease protein [Streptococcus sanguinis SK408]
MKSYIKSNFIKIKNTSFLVVHSLSAVLFPMLLSLYWIQRGHINENTALFSYFQIVGVLLPFASSIVSVQLKKLRGGIWKIQIFIGILTV